MVIWQGAGILGVIIPAVLGFLAQWLVNIQFGDGYAKLHVWHNVSAWLIGAAIVWFMGTHLNSRPGKKLLDPATGQEVELKEKHTLFWLPVQYWAIAWVALAIYEATVK